MPKTKPSPFTPVQMSIIDNLWRMRYILDDNGRIDKRLIRNATVQCWSVGPGLEAGVSAQNIGKLFASRYAAEHSQPRAMRKTPQQLEMLQELWREDSFPTPGQTILVAHDTGLTKEQVKNWFEEQRRKADKKGEFLFTHGFKVKSGGAGKMWRAYKNDPDGYAEALRSGEISQVTGERWAEEE